jgi:glycosyltransferase involved in cell wall biosynthesis
VAEELAVLDEPPAMQDLVQVHAAPDDRELARLYASCLATINPSLYEGFGWPIVEGNALGATAVCRDTSVFREVAGEAGLYFDEVTTDAAERISGQLLNDHASRVSAAKLNAGRFSRQQHDDGLSRLLRDRVARHVETR